MLRMKLFVFPSEEGFCFAVERGRRGKAPAGFGAEPRAGQFKRRTHGVSPTVAAVLVRQLRGPHLSTCPW